MTLPTGKQSGFTLLELLVAVTIAAVVVTAVYSVLKSGLDAYKRGTDFAEETQAVTGFFALMEDDVSKMLAPSAEDTFTASTMSFYKADEDGVYEVGYFTQDGRVIRTLLNTAEDAAEHRADVLQKVSNLEIIYMRNGEWQKEENAEQTNAEKDGAGEREAVQIKVTMESGRVHTNVYRLSGGRVQAEKI